VPPDLYCRRFTFPGCAKVACSPWATADWSRALPQVAEGDRVLFEEYAGISVEINGEKFLLLNEDDILAIVG